MDARAAAVGLLAVLVVLGLPGDPRSEDGALDLPPVLRISAGEAEETGWPAVLRHAAEAPVVAVVTGRPPPVLLDPPRRARAGRTAAIRVHANERVGVMLERPEGARDTLALEPGVAAAFLIRPLTAGWRTWQIAVEGPDGAVRRTAWSALVEPPRPLRILAISGPPDTESDLALRALEEAGEEVEAWIHLGRDVWVGRPGGPLPTEAEAYARADVIVLFPGITLEPPQARALVEAVRERGKGLLLSATDAGDALLRDMVASLFGGAGWQGSGSVGADSIEWSLPPEIPPLPPAAVTVRVRVVNADSPEASRPSPLRLAAPGRGRMGALSLADTWRWRMEAGASDAHRRFWVETISWLSGGFSTNPVLEVMGAEHRAGSPVHVRRLDAPFGSSAAATTPLLTLHGPQGTRTLEPTEVGTTPAGATSLAAFVPTVSGPHVVAAGEGGASGGAGEPGATGATGTAGAPPPTVGVPVLDPAAPTLHPDGRLARIAVASPGGGVTLSGSGDEGSQAGLRTRPWRTLLFTVLAMLLMSAWLRRRLSARP